MNILGIAVRIIRVLIFLACIIGSFQSAAQGNELTPPVPVTQELLDLTKVGSSDPGFEGWVMVRFSVLADGTTADVRVVDSMPPRLSTGDAVAVVKGWKFTPAVSDGKPVDWHNNLVLVSYDIEEIPLEPSLVFSGAYLEVEEYLNREKYEQAKSRNVKMLKDSTRRLYEIGLAQTQLAMIELKLADYHAAYTAITRATLSEVDQLTPKDLKVALLYRFAIEVQLGRYMEALQTFERRQALEPLPDDNDAIKHSRAITEALGGDDALAVKARIDEDPWTYQLVRRVFTIADLDGQIEAIEVECNRRKTVLKFQDNAEWKLPESWGECTLFIDGKRGTTFTVYEFK